MRTLGIWLGTVLAATCMLPHALGGPAVVKKTPSVLHLQENDEFTVRIRQDSAEQAVTVKESLGVGKDAPAGKAETFDITVIDSTPTGDKWLSSRSTPWQVQTIRGKQFAIPWRAATANGVRAIRFPLKGVPYLAPGDQSCCGCGDEGSCGRGCAVEWSYEIEPSRRPADRGDVSYAVSPATLVAGQDNEVTVTVTAASGKLEKGWVRLHVKPADQTATVRFGKLPEGVKEQRCNCGALLAETTMGAAPQTLSFQIVVTPSSPGSLVCRDAVQAGGNLPGLVYPRAQVEPRQEVTRTEQTLVKYFGNLSFEVQAK